MASNNMAFIAAAFYLIGVERKRKRKKPWLERQRLRHSITMSLLESDDIFMFNSSTFHKLLKLVRPFMTQNNTIMKQSVTVEERLVATLLFLASGYEYQELKNKTLICTQLLTKIIPETCDAIFNALKHYIKFPATEEEWKAIAKSFEEKWQLGNCVGCLDARHILIHKPSKSDSSTYINHEGTYSVICMAATNANHEFIYMESGLNGAFSSTTLPQCTRLIEMTIGDDLILPKSYPLPGDNDKTVPYVFIGDSFWPLDTNIMSPYLGEDISEAEKIFNYRIKRANTADNAFGILKSNFHVFELAIDVEIVDKVVIATCVLHNFLIKEPLYFIPDMIDLEDITKGVYIEGDWHNLTDPLMPLKKVNREPWNCGVKVRSDLTEYFNTTGSVPFQDKMVNIVPCVEPIPSENEVWGVLIEERKEKENTVVPI